jgi:hypothetical protein
VTIPVFPAELPPPVMDGYQNARADGRVRRARDAGPRNGRRRFSSVADTVGMSLQLTQNERAIFDQFFDNDARQGALPFMMPDWSKHGWPLATDEGAVLTDDAGNVLAMAAYWLVQFGERLPATTGRGHGLWIVTFEIDVLA